MGHRMAPIITRLARTAKRLRRSNRFGSEGGAGSEVVPFICGSGWNELDGDRLRLPEATREMSVRLLDQRFIQFEGRPERRGRAFFDQAAVVKDDHPIG